MAEKPKVVLTFTVFSDETATVKAGDSEVSVPLEKFLVIGTAGQETPFATGEVFGACSPVEGGFDEGDSTLAILAYKYCPPVKRFIETAVNIAAIRGEKYIQVLDEVAADYKGPEDFEGEDQ